MEGDIFRLDKCPWKASKMAKITCHINVIVGFMCWRFRQRWSGAILVNLTLLRWQRIDSDTHFLDPAKWAKNCCIDTTYSWLYSYLPQDIIVRLMQLNPSLSFYTHTSIKRDKVTYFVAYYSNLQEINKGRYDIRQILAGSRHMKTKGNMILILILIPMYARAHARPRAKLAANRLFERIWILTHRRGQNDASRAKKNIYK